MIPYDDLVAALQAWRARQGLPVSTQQAVANTSNGQSPAPAQQAARPGTPPPAPGGKRTTAPRMPAPLAPAPLAPVDTADEHLDHALIEEHEVEEHVEGALIEESHYENEGDDFAMSFGNNGNGHHHNATSDETLVGDDVADANPARSHNTREDW